MGLFTYLTDIFIPKNALGLVTRFVEIILIFLVYLLSRKLYARYKKNIEQRQILFKGTLLFFLIVFFIFNLFLYTFMKIPFFPIFSLAILISIIISSISVTISLIRDIIKMVKGEETQEMFDV